MTTTKQRINITADPEMVSALRRASKRERVPLASKAAELLRMAISLEEDFILANIADARASKKAHFLKHNEAWK
ncbi:MAG TPA: hypothetical protein VJJ27_01095 [Candidatus Paceibacterota bacterium]